jgi:hypothetical protein
MSSDAQIRLNTLRSAPLNSWIALSEDESRIIAVGSTFKEVSQRSDAVGETDSIILKTPTAWEPLSVGAR